MPLFSASFSASISEDRAPPRFPLARAVASPTLVLMKIGFIGCGKMGSALIQGVLAAKVCESSEVSVHDKLAEPAEMLGTESGIRVLRSNREVASASDVVLLCVKPEDALPALTDAAPDLAGKLLVSIVAGITIESLQQAAGAKCRVVRVMPNTAALVQKGASAYATGNGVTEKDIAAVEEIFTSVGRAFHVKEALLDAVTGLSGSGPAYVYLFIEALADGGVAMGLPRDLATKLAVQTVAGAAGMVSETMMHPALLREMVTSPGGTTIAGLAELERGGLRASVMDAVQAATLRARELGGGDAED